MKPSWKKVKALARKHPHGKAFKVYLSRKGKQCPELPCGWTHFHRLRIKPVKHWVNRDNSSN